MFRDRTFDGADFRGVQVVGCTFEGCAFVDCTFNDEAVTDVTFSGCSFVRVDFDGANLTDTTFAGSTFAGCTMRGSFAERVDLSETRLLDTGLGEDDFSVTSQDGDDALWEEVCGLDSAGALDASGCTWWDAELQGCVAIGARFAGATLVGASFERAVLIDTSFRDALLLDCWLAGAVLTWPTAFGTWRPYATGDGEGFETTLGWDDIREGGSNLGTCRVDFSGLRHNTDEEHEGSEPCDEDGCPLRPPGTVWPAGFEPGPANAARDEVALGDL
jgi:uncharacterized protein YjbI with pentapeptide repeats